VAHFQVSWRRTTGIVMTLLTCIKDHRREKVQHQRVVLVAWTVPVIATIFNFISRRFG